MLADLPRLPPTSRIRRKRFFGLPGSLTPPDELLRDALAAGRTWSGSCMAMQP